MPSVCFYFQVHQPHRLRRYGLFDIGHGSDYFDEPKNREIALKVAHKCYLPMNRVLHELIERHEGAFKVAFSITGTALAPLLTVVNVCPPLMTPPPRPLPAQAPPGRDGCRRSCARDRP